MSLSRPLIAVLLAAVVGLALFPWVGEAFYVQLVVRLMILGIFAMSLDLLIGFTGLVSFGHAAFFGLSGYLLAIVTPDSGPVTVWYALPICLAGTALAALVIGWVSVRTSGIYFIMITLAFAQMLFYFFNENQALGGSDGIFIFFRPTVAVGSLTLIDLDDDLAFYYFVLASLVGAFLILSMVLRAPFGQVIRGIRANEARTRALGFATQHYKLVSFVIAGTLAGYAGFLEATHTGIMSPAHLGWHESGLVMMTVILGGMGTLYGPVLGAFAMGLFQDFVQDLTEYWLLVLGLFVIAVVLFLPDGIAGLVTRLAGRAPAANPDTESKEAPAAPREAAS
jgi:branched-chain amino acid transport system permease protein